METPHVAEIPPAEMTLWARDIGIMALQAATTRGAQVAIDMFIQHDDGAESAVTRYCSINLGMEHASLRYDAGGQTPPTVSLDGSARELAPLKERQAAMLRLRHLFIDTTVRTLPVQRPATVEPVDVPAAGLQLDYLSLLPSFAESAAVSLGYVLDQADTPVRGHARQSSIRMKADKGMLQLGRLGARLQTNATANGRFSQVFLFNIPEQAVPTSERPAVRASVSTRRSNDDPNSPAGRYSRFRELRHAPVGAGYVYTTRTISLRDAVWCDGDPESILRIQREVTG